MLRDGDVLAYLAGKTEGFLSTGGLPSWDSRPLSILQIAPLWEPVPPPAYGGTEAVVYELTEALVQAGHHVTLWASGDSRTSGRHHWVYERSLRTAALAFKPPYEWVHAAAALAEGGEYDIIHNHAGGLLMAFAPLAGAPMLTTTHGYLGVEADIVWRRYQGYWNTISRSQRRWLAAEPGGTYLGPVYNAIDVASFPYQSEKEDFLLFMGRISPEKAPHLAIEAARRAGERIIVAGKVDPNPVDEAYHRETIAPLVDGSRVVYVGEANARQKRDLYRRARALLVPLNWEEPFGLVMIEGMACGTPVIAFCRGAAPELIADRETGFLVEDVDGMVEALARVREIEPARCRRHVEMHFHTPVMAENYLRLYREILKRQEVEAPAPPSAALSASTALAS